MTFALPTEIPLRVAAATANYLDTLQAADTFSMHFVTRWNFADFAERWEKLPADKVYVDVIPSVMPKRRLTGRIQYTWGDEIRIGVRVKFNRIGQDWDEHVDPYDLARYIGVFYGIHDYLSLNNSTNTVGRRLPDDQNIVLGDHQYKQMEIIELWDPDLLVSQGVYQGIMSVPWRVVEIPT